MSQFPHSPTVNNCFQLFSQCRMSHMTTSNVCPHVFTTVFFIHWRVQILACLRHQMVADLAQPRLRKGWVWTVWVLSKSFRSSMHPEMSLAWHTSWWPNFVLQYISTNSARLPDRLRWCWLLLLEGRLSNVKNRWYPIQILKCQYFDCGRCEDAPRRMWTVTHGTPNRASYVHVTKVF